MRLQEGMMISRSIPDSLSFYKRKSNKRNLFSFSFFWSVCNNQTQAARLSQCLMGEDRLLTRALACQVGSLRC